MKDQEQNNNNGGEEKVSRRKFMTKLSLGLAGLSAAVASIPVISALLAPLMDKAPARWRTVGTIADFVPGATKLVSFINADPKPYAGVTAKSSAWVRRDEDQKFTAFAANCTHLGCPVRWEEGAQLFMCPCHGGVFYKDGSVAAGPPPKPLTHYQVRVHNNDIQIKTEPLPITNITV